MTEIATNYRTQTSGPGLPSKAFKRTFFPILILSVLSFLGAVTEGFLFIAWYGAALYWAIALVIAVSTFIISLAKFNPRRYLRIRSGRMLVGVILGIPVLWVSCGINIGIVMSTSEITF
jgi:hypothetical protein